MALAFFMLFAAGTAALMLSVRARENTDDVVNTLEIRGELREVLSLLQDAEIGQRGFLLTRDSQYLQPYNSARLQIGRRLSALESLVDPNTEQAIRVDRAARRRRAPPPGNGRDRRPRP